MHGTMCWEHREQLDKVQAELTYTSNKCSALSRENDLLRDHRPGPPSQAMDEGDPIAEQVPTPCLHAPTGCLPASEGWISWIRLLQMDHSVHMWPGGSPAAGPSAGKGEVGA